ncbi:MAG: heme-binding protein [Gammaproteobacteria bacterium]|uniref:heme-binding protein n=1 Tax=Limnobacter sp. TaxID=2003368 RepID=UPI001E10EC24|nr:heme-binding protein [Limnobacter sp.]MBU0782316.1 heme-binding protein [Gammaproteobacteria bacterium]MBU0849904.1 heme-binding protein [Gammaproteobacteria bacterium]MBU1268670.1 heme-binding protein [Gammaproteobacteria bacterium]MBU1528536.1 heme-binding protein [Gammaproteobacteria bacterium]MBU1781216.1 heme-binding protein [Gammaproteobacteria bacterium]
MKTKAVLSADDVQAILSAARAEADKNNWGVTIAVADDGGHLLGLLRLDGAPPMSAHIGPSKAKTAAMARKETKILEDVINNGRTAFVTAPYVDGLLEGGVPIVVDGQCVGAVGVSGVKSDQDAQIALAGIAALKV